jgi:hypothetical protein
VPYVNEHVHATRLDAQELALQILDIVTLRPEIELCYIGILSKCFEILEGKNAEAAVGIGGITDFPSTPLLPVSTWNNIPFLNHEDSDESSVVSATEDGEDGDDAIDAVGDEAEGDAQGSDSEAGESDASEESEDIGPKGPRLRLREILFFAEKVEIFKVRHGTI